MEDLPLEIKKLIIKFASDTDQRHLRLASTKWFNIVDYNNFTLYLTKKSEWKQIVDRFEKYQRPISLDLCKNIMKDLTDIFEHLTRLTNLTSFNIGATNSTNFSDWDKLTCLSNLKSFPSPFIGYQHHIWKGFPKLEELCAWYIDDNHLADAIVCLTDLRRLSIKTDRDTDNPFKYITEAHSKLMHLEIEYASISHWTDEDLQRLRRLKTLEIIVDTLPNMEKPKYLSLKRLTALEVLKSSFPISDVDPNNSLTMLHRGQLTEDEKRNFAHLQHLKDLMVILEENSDYLTALTSLEDISIEGLRMNANAPDEHNYSILGSLHSTRLTHLSVSVYRHKVDMSYFSRLGSIEVLHLLDAISDRNLLYLERLTRLHVLDQPANNQQEILNFLPRMTTLRHLSYIPNKTGDVPIDLRLLTNLEYLSIDIFSANYSGFEHLTRLTSLNFHGTRHESLCFHILLLPYLEKLTNLRSFECTTYNDAIEYVGKFPNLVSLQLFGINHDDDLLLIADLTKLTRLSVTHPSRNVMGVFLTYLTALQHLNWRGLRSDVYQRLPNLVNAFI